MHDLAKTLITAAAVAAGLPELAVFLELADAAKEKVFLPERRVEMAFLDENLTRQGWRVGQRRMRKNTLDSRLRGNDDERDGEEGRLIQRTRYALYKAVLPVRVLVRSDDQPWLEHFCREFLRVLPSKARDSAGNCVHIAGNRATRKGYTFASIRIEETPTQAIHISFTGIIHKDEDTGFITDVTLHPRFEGNR